MRSGHNELGAAGTHPQPGDRWARVRRGVHVVIVVGLFGLAGLVAIVLPVNSFGVECGAPAVAIAIDADVSSAAAEHHAVCRHEARVQMSAAGLWVAMAFLAVTWPSAVSAIRRRWEGWVLERSRRRGVWRPSFLAVGAWIALAGFWTAWLAGALLAGDLLAGALGVFRALPALLLFIPPPWVRIIARPEGLRIVSVARREFLSWADIVSVEAREHDIRIGTTHGTVDWSAVSLPSWRPRRRRPYAELLAETLESEVAFRRGMTLDQLSDSAVAVPESSAPELATGTQVLIWAGLVLALGTPIAVALLWR